MHMLPLDLRDHNISLSRQAISWIERDVKGQDYKYLDVEVYFWEDITSVTTMLCCFAIFELPMRTEKLQKQINLLYNQSTPVAETACTYLPA